MTRFQLRQNFAVGEEAFPLRSIKFSLDVDLEFAPVGVPVKAARHFALDACRRVLSAVQEGDFELTAGTVLRPETGSQGVLGWEYPMDLDRRAVRSVQRLVTAVARKGGLDGGALASVVTSAAKLSHPTMARLLNDETPVGRYAAIFVSVKPHGRTKLLRLTPIGRQFAAQLEGEPER